MTDAEQLKPCACPVCGCDRVRVSRVGVGMDAVECGECGLRTRPFSRARWADADEAGRQAIAAWNRRPNPSGDADVREAVENILRPIVRAATSNASFTETERGNYLRRQADAILALTGNASTDRAVVPVGEASSMPGTDGFTMAAFKASDVPVGTPLYVLNKDGGAG